MFSDHSGMELEITNKISGKILKYLETKLLRNKPWTKEDVQREVIACFPPNGSTTYRNAWTPLQRGAALHTDVSKGGPRSVATTATARSAERRMDFT